MNRHVLHLVYIGARRSASSGRAKSLKHHAQRLADLLRIAIALRKRVKGLILSSLAAVYDEAMKVDLEASGEPSIGTAAPPTKREEKIVQESKSQAPQVPPEVARYLKGPSPESKQFEFLIGDWDVAATRYKEDVSPLFQYKASWNAKYLSGGRMIVDDFKAHAPTGQAVSSYVALRTYSETTQRWERAGLSALPTGGECGMVWRTERRRDAVRCERQRSSGKHGQDQDSLL